MKHKHLNLQERYYIEIENKKGTTQTAIAQALGRRQGTISKELSRNRGKRGYRHKQAHRLTVGRHTDKPKAIKLTQEVKAFIKQEMTTLQSSPEQVVGRLKLKKNISLHHETVYRFVLADKANGGELYKELRHQKKTYRKRYGTPRNRTGIPNRVDIDLRPQEANDRKRVGDWEADTMIGKNHKGALVTLDERLSKLRFALPQIGKFAQMTKDNIIKLLEPFKDFVKTITFDNGKEFAKHENIAQKLSCDTFFAKPYHSWERGQNENANGLLRQYFPKSMELTDVTIESVYDAVDKLNSRPRKCLGYKTPYEAFFELSGLDARMLTIGIPL